MERVIRMVSSYEHAPFLCFGEKFRGKMALQKVLDFGILALGMALRKIGNTKVNQNR